MPKKKTIRSSKNVQADITLGEVYVDKTHGFEGVAVSYTQFVTGCDRVMLETVLNGDFKQGHFDVTEVERKDQEPVIVERKQRGGPGDPVRGKIGASR